MRPNSLPVLGAIALHKPDKGALLQQPVHLSEKWIWSPYSATRCVLSITALAAPVGPAVLMPNDLTAVMHLFVFPLITECVCDSLSCNLRGADSKATDGPHVVFQVFNASRHQILDRGIPPAADQHKGN